MQIKSTLGLVVCCSLLFAGCGTDDTTDSVADAVTETVTDTVETEVDEIIDNIVVVDPSVFALNSLESIEIVDCTLSNGDASICYSVTVNGFPADRNELEPFCPESIETTADDAGKWFDGGVLYDLTGSFVSNLSVFYGDSKWQLYDKDTGLVNITDTQVACEAAARLQCGGRIQ
ncbi:hypothetical protein [Shewanella phaeophyticola]|uniref:Lipoprotein n=1 Tax=Shewanella phaeophyticola TaxID=2978345 RepID=A0ABT2P3G7_9GAMM|nr:hypothetical protein [Shewanella sp. KJ10-1]MCT8987193.1 hypothetical protein [Shewanella sp. KJ10-1]